MPALNRWLLLLILSCSAFISKAQLVAKFTATPVAGCSPLVVSYTDISSGNPTSWRWDLGNGTISFLRNPSVTYFNPGTYNVKLVVRNASGADSVTKNQYITIYSAPSVAFSATPTTGCFPLPVQFTDLTLPGSGTSSTWEWDFGDGSISNIQNPSHVYTGIGNYNVTLRVKNSFGCIKTLVKPQYIQIASGVHADFTNNVPNSCNPPVTINFQNTSTGVGVLSYQWFFGDGATSALSNPSHTYTVNGSYTVKLIVTNTSGCTDTLTRANAITLGNVIAGFSAPATVCQGSLLTLNNTSTPAPASASWSFGDGTTANTISTTKVYSTPGNYSIKMIANFGACIDSVTKPITVLPKPASNFIADKTLSCKAPLLVNFTNTATGAVSYNWNFGDGSTSTSANPSHTYNVAGSFNVTLIVTNASGCNDTLVKPAYINIIPPGVTITGLPVTGCAPFTNVFSSTATGNEPVTGYLWDFGDGTTSALSNPSHTFASPGSYTITLTITTAGGCTATTTVVDGVVVGSKPTANFSATPRDVCAFIPVNFSDLSTGAVDQWLWFFGDGSISTLPNPTHAYNDTGYFNVGLIVWNKGCPDTISFIKYIHIKPPIANFAVDYNCPVPKQRIFTDASIGADTWAWDFGDGSTSTLPSPVHTYADTGVYVVSLTVTNNVTGCSHTKVQNVQIIIEKANFVASDTVICKGTSIDFQTVGINAANISSYTWNFGDGTLSNSAAGLISHIYTASGVYDVSLIITDILGCSDTLIKPLYIRVDGPTASFKTLTPGSCLNSTIVYADSSYSDGVHPIQQWIWNYGDGTIVNLSAPPFQHTYTTAGTYTITLKVIDSKGCADSTVKIDYVVISKPVATFTADTLTCTGQPIIFTNSSTGPSLTYLWDFGDGSTSTTANPTHTYSVEGTFTISLSITDQYGCTDNMVRTNYVSVYNPLADFTMSDSASTCPPLIVTFTNNSTHYSSLAWDFGDGTTSSLVSPVHFYSMPGTFNAILTVTSPGGCVSVKTRQIVIRGPIGSFTYTPIVGCNPLTANFKATTTDKVSFIWDFNDGSILTTPDSIVSHTYTNTGIYLPKMILVDTSGCQVPIVGIDTIKVYGVTADFTNTPATLCDSGFVVFNAAAISNDLITSYFWNFGDGTTSTLQNPVHGYNTSGLYSTKLVVTTQNGCSDSTTINANVKIVPSPQIGITGGAGACIPATFNFAGQVLVPDTSALSWNWDFANGNVSTLQNPLPQTYPAAGTYTIQAIATNSTGCKDTANKTIQAYPLPVVQTIGDTYLCKANSINLTTTGAVTYTWSPATRLSCSNCANPVATPDTSIQYVVTGLSSQGCAGTDTLNLLVKQPFVMTVVPGDTLCKGGSYQLNANGAFDYVWTPSAGLNNALIAKPIATPLTTTTYMVIGTDDKGCFKDTGYVPIIVYPVPTVDAGSDKTINVGQSVDLVPTISTDVTSANWTPTSGLTRSSYPGITVKPVITTEYTVQVANNGGCKATDKVTIFVICNDANVFLPNTFSPNGDGANDVFYPRGTGVFTIKMLRVFNRWGQVVFEKANMTPNDASIGWDGKLNGKLLTPDVFVYTVDIVCVNGATLTFKGNVALVR